MSASSTLEVLSVGRAAQAGVRQLVAELLRKGEDAGVERDEDEWLDAVAEACKLERADRALRQRIDEDFYGGSVLDAGLRPWALSELRVRKRISEQCGPADYHDIEICGLGPHNATLRAVFRQDCSTREASFRIALFSDVEPVVEVLRLTTTWACETHGFEETEFDSMEMMHCGQCPSKTHACALELQHPVLLLDWLRAAGGHLDASDDVAAFLIIFTLVDLDMMASKIANFLFASTPEHEEEFGSASEAEEDAKDLDQEDVEAESPSKASGSSSRPREADGDDADEDSSGDAKRRKTATT